MFSDTDIYQFRHMIAPFDDDQVQPASYDVRLGNEFYLLKPIEFHWTGADAGDHSPMDSHEDQAHLWDHVNVSKDAHLILQPSTLVLGTTIETVNLNRWTAARFEGKSSLGRIGLLTHVTAGFIDPGFRGRITVELANVTSRPIRIYPGMLIGQLCFFQLRTPCTVPYGADGLGSHYQGQAGPQLAKPQ